MTTYAKRRRYNFRQDQHEVCWCPYEIIQHHRWWERHYTPLAQ